MTSWAANSAILLGSMLVAAMPLSAEAHSAHHSSHSVSSHATSGHATSGHATSIHAIGGHSSHAGRAGGGHASADGSSHSRGGHRYASGYGRHGHGHYAVYAQSAGISCVPFARNETGIALTGNAATWWDEAEGRYARGAAPEAGSVLNFRANASMHLGHVAVVRNVVNSRQIEIDQANWWGPGGGHGVVSRDISVVDVSPHNDWTAVRVALGHTGTFGSVYPTYGFIYQRPDGSDPQPQVMMASAEGGQVLNPPPHDLRARRDRSRLANVHVVDPNAAYDEVAEAPAGAQTGPLQLDAPDRNLK